MDMVSPMNRNAECPGIDTFLDGYRSYVKVVRPSRTLGHRSALRLHAYIYRYHLYQSRTFLLRRFPGIYAAQMKAREDGGLAGNSQWLRHREIYEIVRQHNPASIMEIGSGTSSLMFATMMRDREKFTTYDRSAYWQGRMLSSAGELSKWITSYQADVIVGNSRGETVSYLDIPHDRYFDLVYVDGPLSLPRDYDGSVPLPEKMIINDRKGRLANIDVEMMWDNGVYPRLVVVDVRNTTVRRLYANSGGKYRLYPSSTLSVFLRIKTFPRFQYHSIFSRID